MDSSKIKAIIVAILATFAALYLGITAATAQVETVFWVVGTTGFVICIMMGRRIWLLLPFMSALSLKLPLPGNFTTGLIAQGLVVGFCTLLFLTRRLPTRFKFTELELWGILICLLVAQAYMRNPVGLNIFGSSSVGGKPYAIFAATVICSLLVSCLIVSPRELVWRNRLFMLGSLTNFIIGSIGFVVPSIGRYLGASFANDYRNAENPNPVADEGGATRVSFVVQLSGALPIWVSSLRSPLRACFHPVWAPIVLLSLGLAAFSGFRSQIALVGLTYLVGIAYRGGIVHLVISVTGGATVLAVVALVNSMAPLPANIQRSLSFLPGTWESRYRHDAESSTEWRTEMWVEALTSEKYIRNKIFGDGLGMSAQELARSQQLAEMKRISGLSFDLHRESILISGDYHSGPVQTIKVIGYAGLLILLLAMWRLAVRAHHQILRSKGTEWYPVVLFIGIPIIVHPIFWTFVFGEFAGGTAAFFAGFAWIRMLENNLPLPAYVVRRREAYVLDRRRADAMRAAKS